MTYAFLGAGRMALALVHGLLRAGLCTAEDIVVASRTEATLAGFLDATTARGAKTNAAAVKGADVVILCVKPGDVPAALKSAGRALKGKLLISVATGITIETLRALSGTNRVVRVMPNTAAIVGESATAYAAGEGMARADIETVEQICGAIGKVYPVTEAQLNAVTGLSGSGPAYLYLVIEALSDGGVACGLPRKLALDLAIQTVVGSAAMASTTKEHPAVLREQVTSPGGTTIAGLGVLESAAVRSAFAGAVKAAAQRAKELSAK